jgi:uncharacterized membrane protein YoaK (UPF0700 family)
MNALTGSPTSTSVSELALRRAAASVRHPLSRALLTLTFTTGLIDAVSYLGLGHVFTANMTGNVVLLGFGIAGSGGLPVLAPTISLVLFLIGAGAGGLLVKRMAERHPALVARALGFETLLLAIAAVAAAVGSVHPNSGSAYVLIALMASAMGIRNAVTRHIGVPDLTTTVLTMTLTGLAADSPVAEGSGKGSIRRLTAVLAMLCGAVAGALLLRTSLSIPLGLAAVIALATSLVYVPTARRLDR